MDNYRNLGVEKVSQWFKKFVEKECRGVSVFYYKLSMLIAEDVELLKLAAYSRKGQPLPNLFLGAIHFLLLNNQSCELAQYYPSINFSSKGDLSFSVFKEFCFSNRKAIIDILQTRIVQTNALNRSAYLMPIIFSLFKKDEEICVIDIGTSAGLTLNFDLYEYNYKGDGKFGKSNVKIVSEIKDGELPKFSNQIQIKRKIGIDQNPLDLNIKENALWLKALIWPDMQERFEKMEAAISLAQKSKIEFYQKQTISEFSAIIESVSVEMPLVVFHTHVLYQFTESDRIRFWNMLDAIGRKRNLYYLAAEFSSILQNDYGREGVLIELISFKNGIKQNQLIAETNGHANWIRWM